MNALHELTNYCFIKNAAKSRASGKALKLSPKDLIESPKLPELPKFPVLKVDVKIPDPVKEVKKTIRQPFAELMAQSYGVPEKALPWLYKDPGKILPYVISKLKYDK